MTTIAQKNAAAKAAMIQAYNALPEAMTSSMPNPQNGWGAWAQALMDNGPAFNMFYDNLIEVEWRNVLLPNYFENKLKRFRKGKWDNGSGVRLFATGLIDAEPFSVNDPERELLRRRIARIVDEIHPVNFRRKYAVTRSTQQFKTLFKNEDTVFQALKMLDGAILNSAEWDDQCAIVNIAQDAALNAFWRRVYPKDSSPESLVTLIRTIIRDMEEPRADFNPSGLGIAARPEDLVLITTNATFSELEPYWAKLYNFGFQELGVDVITVSRLSEPYAPDRMAKLAACSPDLHNFTSAELSSLKNDIAFLVHKDALQVWANTYEMHKFFNDATLEFTDFLHIWDCIFATKLFPGVIISSSPVAEAPATLSATVESKLVKGNETVLKVKFYLHENMPMPAIKQTDTATEAGVIVYTDGTIVLPTGKSSKIGAYVRLGDDVEYTSDAAVTGSENFGASITFTKNA